MYIPLLTKASADNREMIGNTVKGTYGVVSVGNDENTRQITGVAAGVKDTDAVNVAQLKALRDAVDSMLVLTYEANSQNRLSLKDAGTGVRISNLAALQSSDGLSVKYDDQGKNVVTLNKRADGTLGDAVRLTNVADGKVSQDSTDAVTGRQLWSLGDSMAKALGGTFKITPDGKIDGSFVDGKGEKTGSLQNMLKEVSENASNSDNWTLSVNGKEEKIGGGKLAIADGSNLDIRRGTDGTYTFNVSETPEFRSVKVGNINIREEGINMGGNSITGLANGGVYRGSTDAVNGDQLWNAYRRISDLDGDIQAVGAHAAAISALHPVPYNPYEPTTISAGIGFYRNEQSIAVGVFHYVRENVLVNAGVSLNTSGRDPMARAGISKKKRPVLARDMVEMQRVMSAMQEKLEEIQKENAEIQKENEKNKEVIRELKKALVVEEEM